MSESAIQRSLFTWARTLEGQYPDLRFLYHVPNGRKRSGADAASLEREGVRAGVWDLRFDGARRGYAGFAGELKYGYNGLEDPQKVWLRHYLHEGIYCCVHYDWVSMARELVTYLWLPEYLLEGLYVDPKFTGPARGRAQIARAMAEFDQPGAGGDAGMAAPVSGIGSRVAALDSGEYRYEFSVAGGTVVERWGAASLLARPAL